MTQWLALFTNPVVFIVAAGCILISAYLLQQSSTEIAFWVLMLTSTTLFAALYAAVSVVRQLRTNQKLDANGHIYQVFTQEDVIVVELGTNLKKLGKNIPDVLQVLSGVRLHLAERYGFVVPDMELEYSNSLAPQTVQVSIRQDIIGQFDIFPDCLAVPTTVDTQSNLIDRIDNQFYAWTPNEEVNLQDRAVALTAREFFALRIQSMLLDAAPTVLTRTDALKLMAIVQRQDPSLFHDLFELNQLNANTFKTIIGESIQQRNSVRNIAQLCESLLKGQRGISQLGAPASSKAFV
jgi:flagellar biosynthesis component FlhA